MKRETAKTDLSKAERDALLETLKARFEKHPQRHPKWTWKTVEARLGEAGSKLWSLHQMESTSGEPDVVSLEKESGALVFMDCSPESPQGRAGFCYDREGLESRKEHKPKNTVIDCAREMGIEVLTEAQYRELQKLGNFDLKSSSWIQTPAEIRALGGALFCDRRYGQVFVYHNGAQSYYSGRGFRGVLTV